MSLPLIWEEYERIQVRLAHRDAVDDLTWGLEAGLNRVLTDDTPSPDEVDLVVRSESRKERHRQGLRSTHERVQDVSYSAAMEHTLDTRRRVRSAVAKLPKDQWALVRAIALGYDYDEIARRSGISPGTLRARMFRIRRTLTDRSEKIRAAS